MTQQGRTILKRVVFYDLLSMAGRNEPTSVDSHISIPLDPGMGAIWAPNGYGKTFAFKLLNMMIHPQEYSDSAVGDGSFWLGSFLERCYDEVREPSSRMTIGELQDSAPTRVATSGSWKSDDGQRMVPFSRMLARFVTLDDDGAMEDVKDLWLEPDWTSGGRECRTRLCSYRDLLETHSLVLKGIVSSGAKAWDGEDPASLRPLLLKPWGDVHLGTNQVWVEPMVEMVEGLEEEGMLVKAKMSATSLFDFLKDDGDLEIVELVSRLDIDGVNLDGYRGARSVGGSEQDPFLPVIPSPYRLFDLFEEGDVGSSYSPDMVVNWTEVMESVDTSGPRDEFVMTQTNSLLDVMRRTHVWYVEVPKSVSDHGLSQSQSLVSGMLETLGIGEVPSREKFNQLKEELEDRATITREEIHKSKYAIENLHHDNKGTYDSEKDLQIVERREKELLRLTATLIEIEQRGVELFDRYWGADQFAAEDLSDHFTRKLEDSINRILSHDQGRNPWAREVRIWNGFPDDRERGLTNPMTFHRYVGQLDRPQVREDTLSFGQKSAITTECWLAWLENEDIDTKNSEEIRRCLILDEPEAGRSEYWIGLLADRIVDASDVIEGVRDKTLMVMSHREELLSNVGWDGHFHVMQPSDVRDAFEDEEWGEGRDGEDREEMDSNLMPGPLEVIEMGMEFPDFVGLGLIPTNLHRGVIEVDVEVLRTETLREFCRMMRIPDHGRKHDLIDRVLSGLDRVFMANTFDLDKRGRAELAKISGFDITEHKEKSEQKRTEALAKHALWSMKKGEIRGYGKPGSQEEE